LYIQYKNAAARYIENAKLMEMRGLARLAEEAGNANFTAIDEGLDAS